MKKLLLLSITFLLATACAEEHPQKEQFPMVVVGISKDSDSYNPSITLKEKDGTYVFYNYNSIFARTIIDSYKVCDTIK